MIDLANLEAWFVAGSQHLCGPETLKSVAEHSAAIASVLSVSTQMPVKMLAPESSCGLGPADRGELLIA
jgi:L-arabinose isomerase